MNTLKEKIHLTPEEETLLITLYTRVVACPGTILEDPKGHQILESVDYDFSALKVPTGTRLTVCLRARKFDDYARAFLAAHPQGTVLHLGCGLDTRYDRIQPAQAEWYDLDLPEVVTLRRQFFTESEHYHMLASSVTDLAWLEAIPAQGQPVLVLAEGLLMYLTEAEVKALFLALRGRFPGCQMVFDAFSTLTARNVGHNPSLKKTGAVVRWGIDDARAIETWAPGMRLVEEWYFTDSDLIDRFGRGYQMMFKLSSVFPVAKKAHRVVVVEVGEERISE